MRAATSLAHLLRAGGDVSDARDLLARLFGWFTEGFDTQSPGGRFERAEMSFLVSNGKATMVESRGFSSSPSSRVLSLTVLLHEPVKEPGLDRDRGKRLAGPDVNPWLVVAIELSLRAMAEEEQATVSAVRGKAGKVIVEHGLAGG